MKRKITGVLSFIAIFGVVLWTDIGSGDELIEPTRELGGNEKQWGGLTIFSEPPQMDAYVDGKKVGRTPVWLQQVEATTRILQIGGIKTSVQVKKGKTVRIGIFKGALVKLPDVDQLVAPSESKKKRESQRPFLKQEIKGTKRKDLSLWERYINGSLRHF